MAVHVRLRLSQLEQLITGDVRDIRGTAEELMRLEQLDQKLTFGHPMKDHIKRLIRTLNERNTNV